MALAETANLVASLALDDRKFTAGAKRAGDTLGRMEKGFGRASRGAGQLSAGVARAGALIGTAVVGGFTAAATAAINWEDAFAGVRKTVEATPAELDALAESLRQMSLEMPNSAIELAGIAEQAGALGITGTKNIEAFTKQVAILAATTDISAETAASSLGALQNIIGLTTDEFDNFAAALVDLGNKGSSTESAILEIANRSGQAAKLFGLAKDQTLGWAAAAANLNINQEAAGTALQKLFLTLLPTATKESKVFGEVMGKNAKQVKKAFKEDAGGALEDFIIGLKKLGPEARQATVAGIFGRGSGITRLILGLADSVDSNLTPSLKTAAEAWKAATAAQIEFDKRNATVKSAIIRLKNTVIDAAVSIGEGMAPALGRAADKLAGFLKSGENRSFLKSIGEDIGDAIDGIDWASVISGAKDFVGLLKIALDYAKGMFDAVNKLPTEIKAATLGFLTLNKLSGGLIGAGVGNIIGGLGETLTRSLGASLPGALGRAFVQPVLVTNWQAMPGAGALGAAGGAGGGGILGKLNKVLGVLGLVTAGLALVETFQSVNAASSAQAAGVRNTSKDFLATNPTTDAIRNSLAGIDKGIADLESNPLHVLVQGSALEQLKAMRADFASRLGEEHPGKNIDDVFTPAVLTDSMDRAVTPATAAVDSLKGKIADDLAAQTSTIDAAGRDTSSAATSAGIMAANASRSAGATVAAAVAANRPITYVDVNVSATTVNQVATVQTRYGSTGSDRTGDTGSHGGNRGELI